MNLSGRLGSGPGGWLPSPPMGKASQAKKAAREARERGETAPRRRRRPGFAALLALVVVLGAVVIWWARRPETPSTPELVVPPTEVTDPNGAADPVPGSTTITVPPSSVVP